MKKKKTQIISLWFCPCVFGTPIKWLINYHPCLHILHQDVHCIKKKTPRCSFHHGFVLVSLADGSRRNISPAAADRGWPHRSDGETRHWWVPSLSHAIISLKCWWLSLRIGIWKLANLLLLNCREICCSYVIAISCLESIEDIADICCTQKPTTVHRTIIYGKLNPAVENKHGINNNLKRKMRTLLRWKQWLLVVMIWHWGVGCY